MTQAPRLEAFKMADPAFKLVPCSPSRAWMDAFNDRHAYRCLPLTIANVHGWNILCPIAIEVSWNGGPDMGDVTVRNLEPLPKNFTLDHFARSNFTRGIITMHTNYLFRTPPGWNLLTSGPFNNPKSGIYPLTGIIETDWLPYPFTMNWQMLNPGKVRFERDEPFCMVMPVPKHYLESWDVVVHDLNDDPILQAEQNSFRTDRDDFMKRWHAKDPATLKQGWQRHYFVGRYPDGTSVENHTNKVRLAVPQSGIGIKPLYAKSGADLESANNLIGEENRRIEGQAMPPGTEKSSLARREEELAAKLLALAKARGENAAAGSAGKRSFSQKIMEFAANYLLAEANKVGKEKTTSEAAQSSCPMHRPAVSRHILDQIPQKQSEKNFAGRARLDKGVLTPSSDTLRLAPNVDTSSLDFIFDPEFLSPAQSKLLAKTAKALSEHQHIEGIEDPYWQGRILFYADIAKASPEAAALMKDTQNRITKRLQEFYRVQTVYTDTTQLVQWRKGMHMEPHADNANPDGSKHGMAHRDFASIVYLNDDYTGGELYFTALDTLIRPRAGMLVAFTGGWHHEHAVLKVRKGLRLTMPAFYTLDAAKKDVTFYT